MGQLHTKWMGKPLGENTRNNARCKSICARWFYYEYAIILNGEDEENNKEQIDKQFTLKFINLNQGAAIGNLPFIWKQSELEMCCKIV